jgi:hypothetical protein
VQEHDRLHILKLHYHTKFQGRALSSANAASTSNIYDEIKKKEK